MTTNPNFSHVTTMMFDTSTIAPLLGCQQIDSKILPDGTLLLACINRRGGFSVYMPSEPGDDAALAGTQLLDAGATSIAFSASPEDTTCYVGYTSGKTQTIAAATLEKGAWSLSTVTSQSTTAVLPSKSLTPFQLAGGTGFVEISKQILSAAYAPSATGKYQWGNFAWKSSGMIGNLTGTKVLPVGNSAASWPGLSIVYLSPSPNSGNTLQAAIGTSTSPSWIYVSSSSPPKLEGVTDFTVVTNETNTMLYACTSSGGLYSTVVDSYAADPPSFAPWNTIDLSLAANSAFESLEVILLPTGDLQVFLLDSKTNLWTSRQSNGEWTPAVAIEESVLAYSVSIDPAGMLNLVFVTQNGQLNARLQDEDGIWSQLPIGLPSPSASDVTEKAAYRTQCLVLDPSSGDPLPSTAVSISSATDAVVRINGVPTFLPQGTPVNAVSDAFGAINILSELSDSLYCPEFTVTPSSTASDLAADPPSEALQPSKAVEEYLQQVTATQLLQATNPQNQQPLLSPNYNSQSDAEQIAAAIREILASNSDTAFRPWSLRRTDSGLEFRYLDDQEFASPVGDFLGLDFDDLGDVLEGAVDGLVSIAKVTVVSPTSWVIQGLISGAQYLLKGTTDAPDYSNSVLSTIFIQAEILLGNAAGWLVSEVGFFIDWAAVKTASDNLKSQFVSSSKTLISRMPSPSTYFSGVETTLSTLSKDLENTIRTLDGSNQANDTLSYNSANSQPTSIVALLGGNYDLLANPISMVQEAFQNAPTTPSSLLSKPTIPGLSSALNGLDLTTLETAFEDLANPFEKLVTGANVQSLDLSSVATAMMTGMDSFVTAAASSVRDFEALFTSLQDGSSEVLEWLDQPLDDEVMPLLIGFYEGMFDETPSLLDLALLPAAVPYSILESSRESRSMPGAGESNFTFWSTWSWAILNAVNAPVQIAATDSEGAILGGVARVLGVLTSLALVVASVALFVDVAPSDWALGLLIFSSITAIVGLIFQLVPEDDLIDVRALGVMITSAMGVLAAAIFFIALLADGFEPGWISDITGSISYAIEFTTLVPDPSPAVGIGYTVAQGGLGLIIVAAAALL